MEIVSIEKEDRQDISNYIITLEDGRTIGIQANSKSEAKRKVVDYLEPLKIEQ